MRRLMKYGKAYGGSDPEMVEGDIFRIMVKVPEFQQSLGEKEAHLAIAPEVRRMLGVIKGEMSREEIMVALGLKDQKHFRKHYQQVAIALQVVEMTIPDKPRSSKQKYRLTELGKQLAKQK